MTKCPILLEYKQGPDIHMNRAGALDNDSETRL